MFLFFKKRKRSPSFLFRRKKRSACAGSAAPQTDGRRHILRCRRSEYRSGYASLLRLVSARVRRACAPAFPCKPTTQKKINCGAAFLLCSCRFRQRAAQNGRFTYEPSVFPFLCRTCGRTSFLRSIIYPAVSFVSFLQEKKTSPYQEKKSSPPSFLFRRKENIPASFSIYANKQSKTHGHMQTVRFGRCCVLSEKAEKSECVPRAAGSPPPTVGGPRRMQRRVQRSSASCTGRSPYRACPV